MSKTKEYSSDVQQKIAELHKIKSGWKKLAKALKISVYTIRQKSKSSNQHASTRWLKWDLAGGGTLKLCVGSTRKNAST